MVIGIKNYKNANSDSSKTGPKNLKNLSCEPEWSIILHDKLKKVLSN